MLAEYLQETRQMLEEIIEKYPKQIPPHIIAEYFGCKVQGLNQFIDNSAEFGIGWKLDGKINKSHCIPTRVFIPWAAKNLI